MRMLDFRFGSLHKSRGSAVPARLRVIAAPWPVSRDTGHLDDPQIALDCVSRELYALPRTQLFVCRCEALSYSEKDEVMPKYLVEGRYTSDGLKGLAREASSQRRVDIAKTIESAGGKLEAFYFAFGDADFYIVFDVPDNISAAALSMVANQSRFVTSKTVVLMTADEMDQAIKKTKTIEFLPPGH